MGMKASVTMIEGFKRLGFLLFLPLWVVASCASVQLEEVAPAVEQPEVQEVLSSTRVIQTPRGINELVEVEIGGIPQWLSVRGRDRRNPILLFIHGGPGVTEMPISWYYQGPLEDYFTVVQWDQRGSGKTAASSDLAEVIPTITIERMVQDGEEMVAYLRKHYGKEKIFVLGHSWGSVIGLEIAERHPSWLHAYIGMGQVVYTQGNEEAGYRFALNQAREKDNQTAVQELEAIAPYPKPDGSLAVTDILTQRKWLSFFGGMTWGRPDLDYETNLRHLSPDYTDADHTADSESGSVAVQQKNTPYGLSTLRT